MLATLCVSEIGAIVLMYCEAETALKGADMVLEEIGVFVKIDGFEGKFAKSFAAVGIGGRVRGYSSPTEFGASSILRDAGASISISSLHRTGCTVKCVPGNPLPVKKGLKTRRFERKIRKISSLRGTLLRGYHVLSLAIMRFCSGAGLQDFCSAR